MAFNSTSDFLALFRANNIGGVDTLRMPIIDAILQTLADNGLFTVVASTVAPIANQSTTIWLQTQVPSYNGPGTVMLWQASTQSYQPATPQLFAALIFAAANNFPASIQSVVTSGAFVTNPQASAIILNRPASGLAPSSTTLPSAPAVNQTFTYDDAAGNFNGNPLTVNAPAGMTISGQASFVLQTNFESLTFRYVGLLGAGGAGLYVAE